MSKDGKECLASAPGSQTAGGGAHVQWIEGAGQRWKQSSEHLLEALNLGGS